MDLPMPPPGAPPMGGPPPPGFPGGTGAAMAPGPMPGNQAQGMASVKLAIEALQKALPALPMGGDLHTSVLNALTGITKHMDDNGPGAMGGGQDDMVQQLVALARQGQGGAPPPGMPPGGAPPPGMGAPPPGMM